MTATLPPAQTEAAALGQRPERPTRPRLFRWALFAVMVVAVPTIEYVVSELWDEAA